ncbi:MAG TPA: bifunctional diaminohydroxyphosphoribosylaminopyrimidine deaminase/5-amino-6-(5-phosphoribosylamino)uracil reductase RibD, partial [Gammaproteobacteria bacterium]|nr:bifunctional diaminohydroxyphosphoribosylaminopyrimidine deaminase/5-amino-6-(5-phosphoribosylamino)uracil reductase RibD [Gammaproteobacteria bacterium]MCH76973.1 bifunctional diaminohydroxyphosphoribosylaminopyrimidine deaminase/5-amino-6-(5-phosphoribosylamino)uracil reductase RibD [Gammaproteobacteria bacterium]
MDDTAWMRRALALAEGGRYTAAPNPRVGCVLVRGGLQVGAGYHPRAGAPHAEAHALAEAGDRARGATAYVTLEPCAHHGRTPPCAEALIAAGVSRVVAAMTDPNPQVAGQGLARLRAAGVAVDSGLLGAEAAALNPGFIKRMTSGRPYVRVKVAQSLDGRSALGNGHSRWITGPAARADVQHWRARSQAIVTGSGTVLADDPQLTVRDVPGAPQPLRVVLDSSRSSVCRNARHV